MNKGFEEMSNEELNETFKKLQPNVDGVSFVKNMDEEIEFGCSRCGGCCSGRDDIMLSPYDVWNMARGLNCTSEEILKKYVNMHVGGNSNLPILTINSDSRNLCHFLTFDTKNMVYGCSINDNKPGACELHPFGACYSKNLNSDEDVDTEEHVRFIMTTPCSSHNNTKITPRKFLQHYIDNIEYRKLSNELMSFPATIVKLGEFNRCFTGDIPEDSQYDPIRKFSPNTLEGIYNVFYSIFVELLYNIDVTREFDENLINDIKKQMCIEMVKVLLPFDLLKINFKTEKFFDIFEQYCEDIDIDNLIKELGVSVENLIKEADERLQKEVENNDSN